MKITTYALLLAAAWPAMAQQPAPRPGMSPQAHEAVASPSTKAFKAADEKMMHGMGGPMTGDPDRDFVSGMIPHHQGAVDMAKVELQYGKNPEMRRLATNIVQSQEKEIARMKAWQKKYATTK